MRLPETVFTGLMVIMSTAALTACGGASDANAFADCSAIISPPGDYSFSEATGRVIPEDGGTEDGAAALQNCVDSAEA